MLSSMLFYQLAESLGRRYFTLLCPPSREEVISPLEGGLRSDDSDEYQTPSEGMIYLLQPIKSFLHLHDPFLGFSLRGIKYG